MCVQRSWSIRGQISSRNSGRRLSLRGRGGEQECLPNKLFEPRVGLIAGPHGRQDHPLSDMVGVGVGVVLLLGETWNYRGLQGCFRPLFYDFVYLESSECSVVGSLCIILHCSAFLLKGVKLGRIITSLVKYVHRTQKSPFVWYPADLLCRRSFSYWISDFFNLLIFSKLIGYLRCNIV